MYLYCNEHTCKVSETAVQQRKCSDNWATRDIIRRSKASEKCIESNVARFKFTPSVGAMSDWLGSSEASPKNKQKLLTVHLHKYRVNRQK